MARRPRGVRGQLADIRLRKDTAIIGEAQRVLENKLQNSPACERTIQSWNPLLFTDFESAKDNWHGFQKSLLHYYQGFSPLETCDSGASIVRRYACRFLRLGCLPGTSQSEDTQVIISKPLQLKKNTWKKLTIELKTEEVDN